ncbi:MAG: sensor histidine kinase [Hespellia sp.]|nr:sensor histidine kinase [Hespellia sp.]
MMKKRIRLSLNKRLTMISVAVLLPMMMLVVYLLSSLASTTKAYDEITASVSYASKYSKDFKERMDYSMYLAVIAGKSMAELGNGSTTVNGIETVNPYSYIAELNKACDELAQVATVDSNKSKIKNLKKSLSALEKCVGQIEDNIAQTGNYDTNMALLDENIYMLTSIIQDGIQDYIHVETQNLENVRGTLERSNERVFYISLTACLIVSVLALVLSIIASRSVTRPIRELCRSLGKVAKGDFTTKTQVESDDEIAVLTESFNEMTTEIGQLVEDIKTEQMNLSIIETRLLQAQINPHFLYNTLDTIVWLAEEKQTKEVVSMVTWLSDFFRSTLSEGRDSVTVEEEKHHIESYLKIQQFRYQDIMDYRIDIDKEILDYKIPKLTLQPLVENALYHGIKNKRGKGMIYIHGCEKNGKLFLAVEDNGKGMTEESLNVLRKSMNGMDETQDRSGFGLKNVNQRIRYYCGEEYGLFFESEENKGTKATAILSAKKNEPFS